MGSQRGGRLLVVDFGFFFHNPFEGLPAPHRGAPMLYDWAHSETQFLRESIWAFRAQEFLQAGLEPPRCEGYHGFWDRFTFTSRSAPLIYADSNLHAGHLTPAHYSLSDQATTAWEEVHLFDAHHDSGYPHENGPTTFEEWREQDQYSCEDWMLVHHEQGSQLTLTYPPWRPTGDNHPPMVPLRTNVDDQQPVPTTFDAVFLCRSGAWVPSWCDDQFTQLLEDFPGSARLFPESGWSHPRPDPLPAARRMSEVPAQLRARVSELAVPPKIDATPAPWEAQPPLHHATPPQTRQPPSNGRW
jgi:hypothetical protein